MKIWIVANRPIGNDFWLKKSIEEKYPPNIEVGILAARKTATEFRKYGKFGWMAVQVIQFGIAAKAYRKSSDKDIIITTSFPVGRWISLISGFLRRKRKILAVNCLQQRSNKLMIKIDKVLDKFVWRNQGLITTVNSKSAIKKLTIPEYVKSNNKIYIYPDTFLTRERIRCEKKYDYMTGGYANRDFSLFFKIADNNKDKKFVCVVGSNFKTDKYNIPSNVTLFQDVPPPRFKEIMNESKVILVPLLNDDVAGLVVVKNAISYKIPFVASDIEAIRNYIPNQYWDMVLSPLEKPEIFEKKSLDIYKMCDKWDDVSNLIEIYAQKYAPVNRINEILRIFQEEGWIE